MKKYLLLSVAALALMSTSGFAQPANDKTPPAPPPGDEGGAPHHDWTLSEARQKAHEHADKLDKMTEAEWSEHEKKRREFMNKWDKMTPEEKEADRQKHKAWRAEHPNGPGGKPGMGAPSSGAGAPPAPPPGQ